MRVWLLMTLLALAACKKEPEGPVGLATPIPHAPPRAALAPEEPEAAAAPTPASDLVPIDTEPDLAAPSAPADLLAIPDSEPPAPAATRDAGVREAGSRTPKRRH